MKPYTDEQIREEYLKTKNMVAVARKFGIDPSTVARCMKRMGVKAFFARGHRQRHYDLSKEPLREMGRIDEIRPLAVKGLTSREIGGLLCMSESSVSSTIYYCYCTEMRYEKMHEGWVRNCRNHRERQRIIDRQHLKNDLENPNSHALPLRSKTREILLRVFDDYL